MCCSECLARSGVTAWQGDYWNDKSTAVPSALRDIIGPMSYLENGGEKAKPWTPEIRRRGAALDALHSAFGRSLLLSVNKGFSWKRQAIASCMSVRKVDIIRWSLLLQLLS